MKKNLKISFPHSSLLPRLNVTPNSLPLLPLRGAGARGMGLVVSSSHTIFAAPSSSHFSPAPVWGPSHGRQSTTNFFENEGSPQSQNLLQMHPPAPAWGPPWAADGYLLHHGPLWAVGGEPASPWSSPWAAQKSLLCHLEPLLPLLLHWSWCLQSFFCHFISLLTSSCCCAAVFYSSWLCYYRDTTTITDWFCNGKQGVCLGTGWHWVCLIWGKLLALSHRSHPCSPLLPKPCHENPIHRGSLIITTLHPHLLPSSFHLPPFFSLYSSPCPSLSRFFSFFCFSVEMTNWESFAWISSF